MQADDQGHNQPSTVGQNLVHRCGKGGADYHALGHIMQRNRRGHHQPRQEQPAARLASCHMLVQVVCVSQFFERVCRLRVVFVNMRHFMVRCFIDPCIQQCDHRKACNNPKHHQPDIGSAPVSVQRLCQEIKANHGGHHAGRKGKQKADCFIGIFPEQAGNHSAQSRSAYAGNGCDSHQKPN